MTNPRRYLIRMIIFLLAILAVCAGLFNPLKSAFMGNIVINSIILFALLIGIAFTIRQILRLIPEHYWMLDFSRNTPRSGIAMRPSLLAPVAVIMAEQDGRRSTLSAQNMRSVLDGVAVRLDESREISRYMIGLLVFLGLLGTFWGLLSTVQAVGNVVGGIDTSLGNMTAMMAELKAGLDAPLIGMATAFSSSLFGLAGSLVLGFLDLQLGQASGRFYTDVEDWLSKSVRLDTTSEITGMGPEMTQGLSEAAAESMLHLARVIEKSETERSHIAESLRDLTAKLAQYNAQAKNDTLLSENIANLEAALIMLAREMKADRNEMTSALTTEIRALSKSLSLMMKKP
jgi:hypothetical protein